MPFVLCESDTALNRRLEISIRALRSRRSLGAELTRDVIARAREARSGGTADGTEIPPRLGKGE